MPAQSKQQQKFMGIVHAIQKGELDPKDASSDAQQVAKDMKPSDVKDFASTPHKGLPKKVKQEILKKLKEYAGKMGRDHMGGDSIPSQNKGGLRDNDGYDNVDYNKDMPQDEGNIPTNWLQGRTSDYHTKKGTTPREDYEDTNFDKKDSGQPDLKEENPCWDGYKQVGMKNKGGKQVPNCVKESVNESFNELEHLKLLNLAMKAMPGSPKQKEIIKKLNQVRIDGGMKPLKEAAFHALNNPRMKKSLSNLVKDKKVKNPETGRDVSVQTAVSNPEHPAHDRAVSIKQSLLQRLKGMMKNEYGSVATDNFLLPSEEDKLEGTPKPKMAIGESLDFNEREMVVGIIDILKQVDDKENRKRIALNMIKKFKEEGIEFDYQKFLNHLKEYSMGSYEYNENKKPQISEAMFVMMRDIAQDILPKDVFQRAVSPQGREDLESIMSDLKNTLNKFFKMHKINKIVK